MKETEISNRPLKILMVDDDEDYLVLIKRKLHRISDVQFDIQWAMEYNDALRDMQHNLHDVYLIDYGLGERTGLDLLREALLKGCDRPLIIITGQGDRRVDMEAMRAGAADYLVKGSFDGNTLERCIRYAIEHKRSEERERALAAATAAAEVEREKSAELARSNAELEQFAYIASHDLQEPLRNISSFVQLLARRYQGRLDSDADEFIQFAVDGVARMEEMIKGILAYSRVETHGKDFKAVGCADVLQKTLKNLALSIEESQAEILSNPLPVVRGDEAQLIQLFQNLIGNALKFRREESPRVNITVRSRAAAKGHTAKDGSSEVWLFSIEDNGIGIERNYCEQIFSMFRRLHSPEVYSGTGIGLAICRKIVERHNGEIWVESTRGEGATFYFTLPPSEAATSTT